MARSREPQPMIIPSTYDGLWSGWTVRVIFHNKNVSDPIDVDSGVRGMNCKCKVTVDDDGYLNVV